MGGGEERGKRRGKGRGKRRGKERGEGRGKRGGNKKNRTRGGSQGACPLAGVKGTGPLAGVQRGLVPCQVPQDLSPTRRQLGTFSKTNPQNGARGASWHGEPTPTPPPLPHPPTPLHQNDQVPTLTGWRFLVWHPISHVSTWAQSPCSMEHATTFPAQNNPISTELCPPTFVHPHFFTKI